MLNDTLQGCPTVSLFTLVRGRVMLRTSPWLSSTKLRMRLLRTRVNKGPCYKLVEGRIDEQWVNLEARSMMQQLGVVPEPSQQEGASPT